MFDYSDSFRSHFFPILNNNNNSDDVDGDNMLTFIEPFLLSRLVLSVLHMFNYLLLTMTLMNSQISDLLMKKLIDREVKLHAHYIVQGLKQVKVNSKKAL